MSTDTDRERAVGSRLAPDALSAALEHPLLGTDPRRTAATLAALAALTATVLVSYLASRVTVDGVVLDALSTRFDTLATIELALVTPTILLVPPAYALWNGGPGLSFALPLVPVAVGDALAGAYVLDVDAAIALTVGACAAAIALVSSHETRRVWRSAVDENRLLFVTAAATVGAVGVARFVAAAPPYLREWYAPFGATWLATAGILAACWIGRLRAPAGDRSDADS